MSELHSLALVGVDGIVSCDGSGLRSSPCGNGDVSGNLGESVVVGGLSPGGVGGHSSLVSGSSVLSPASLDLAHLSVVLSGKVPFSGPHISHLSSVSPSGEPGASDVSLVVHDLDGVVERSLGSEEVLVGLFLMEDGGVVHVSGVVEGLQGSSSVLESSGVGVDGSNVSVDGFLVSGNSSFELSGELSEELGSVSGAVVGCEVSEGFVSADGSKSHVLLDELSSGSFSGLVGFLVVEEREVTEVSLGGGGGGSDGGGSDEGDLGEHCYFINYSLDSSCSGQHNSAN